MRTSVKDISVCIPTERNCYILIGTEKEAGHFEDVKRFREENKTLSMTKALEKFCMLDARRLAPRRLAPRLLRTLPA